MIQSSRMTNKINDLLISGRPPHRAIVRGVAVWLLATTTALSAAQPGSPAFISYPDIHGTTVVFTAADDLWLQTVDSNTASARRLTETACLERFAKFSPDGAWLAHNLECSGRTQLAITDLNGKSRVLHSLPALNNGAMRDGPAYRVAGWTPSGDSVWVIRKESNTRTGALLSVAINTGQVTQLDIGPVGALDIAPSGQQWLLTPQNRDFRHRRAYQGGGASEVYRHESASGARTNVSNWAGTDRDPVWLATGEFFVSDRSGRLNLYQRVGRTVRPRTTYATADVRWASGDGEKQIVFEVDGRLGLYNSDTETLTDILVRLPAAGNASSGFKASGPIHDVALAPGGQMMAISLRGDIVVRRDGHWRSITEGNANDVQVRWNSQGTALTYLRRDAAGEQLRTVTLATGVSKTWVHGDVDGFASSPSGQSMAIVDRQGQLFLVADGFPSPQAMEGADSVTDLAWLDDRMLIIVDSKNHIKQIDIDGTSRTLSLNGASNSGTISGIAVDHERRDPWLLVDQSSDTLPWITPDRQLTRLNLTGPSTPTIPAMAAAPIGAFAVYEHRIDYLLRDNTSQGQHSLWRWDLKTGAHHPLATQLSAFAFSPDGNHVLLRAGRQWKLGRVSPPRPTAFSPVPMPSDHPFQHAAVDEWQQMLDESWHRYRHAHRIEHASEQAWRGVRQRYSELLARAHSRHEAMVVIARMLGESGASHAWLEPADPMRPKEVADRSEEPTKRPGGLDYLHLPNTDRSGFEMLLTWSNQFPDQGTAIQQGLIVDLRGSRGGAASNQILTMLDALITRSGRSLASNVVMIVDAHTASDAELLAAMAQSKGVNVVGQRTWGGGLSIERAHRLVDGSRLYVPVLPEDRRALRLTIEGRGVTPNWVVAPSGGPQDLALQQAVTLLQSEPAAPSKPNALTDS